MTRRWEWDRAGSSVRKWLGSLWLRWNSFHRNRKTWAASICERPSAGFEGWRVEAELIWKEFWLFSLYFSFDLSVVDSRHHSGVFFLVFNPRPHHLRNPDPPGQLWFLLWAGPNHQNQSQPGHMNKQMCCQPTNSRFHAIVGEGTQLWCYWQHNYQVVGITCR